MSDTWGTYPEPVNDNTDEVIDSLLMSIELERTFFVRFREAWLDGNSLCVRARLGGEDSRRHYAQVFALLRSHPRYVLDEDDLDATYCTFYFSTSAAPPGAVSLPSQPVTVASSPAVADDKAPRCSADRRTLANL